MNFVKQVCTNDWSVLIIHSCKDFMMRLLKALKEDDIVKSLVEVALRTRLKLKSSCTNAYEQTIG
jgi:predicted glycosyl hydrolase (DUF1957 family)